MTVIMYKTYINISFENNMHPLASVNISSIGSRPQNTLYNTGVFILPSVICPLYQNSQTFTAPAAGILVA